MRGGSEVPPVDGISATTLGVIGGCIAGVQILLLTVVQSYLTGRKDLRDAAIRANEKRADYERQDQVAERVATAANTAAHAAGLLVKAQAETIARTDEVARLAEAADKRINAQLVAIDEQGRKIHILVNSDMTAARTAERDSMKLLVLSLRNAYSLSVKLGVKLTGHEQEEIDRVEERIEELNQILADRLAAQAKVDAEAKAHRVPPP
jgi:hypothetical protein